MKKNGSIISVFLSIVFVAVVLALIGMLFAFTNNGSKNFYVQYGSETISSEVENEELQKNAYNIFYCKNILGVTEESSKVKNFTVKVLTNEKAFSTCDFSTVRIDDKEVKLFHDSDVTSVFDIYVGDGYFSLYLPEQLTVELVLNKVYPDSEITGVPNIDLYEKDYFTLVIYSVQEKSTISIGFH